MGSSKPTQATKIAAEIEREIIGQRWAAGMKLDEAAIAKRFGVSRTPVREALHLLVSRSLAERRPYRGVVVTEVGRERIEEMFEAAIEIEALCIRFSTARMTAGERGKLLNIWQNMTRMVEENHVVAFFESNLIFHQFICDATRNSDLSEMATMMRRRIMPFRSAHGVVTGNMLRRIHKEHEEIVQAVLDNDSRTAERAMRRHLARIAHDVLRRLDNERASEMPMQN